MLIIRKSQLDALGEVARRSFEDKMLDHLAGFSPSLVKAAGEAQLRKSIHLGVTRAGRYGLTHQGPVRLYLELMLLFGAHFDTDPQYPWAAQLLLNPGPVSQQQRAEWLFEKALEHQARAVGPQDDYASCVRRAIRFFTELSLATVTEENFLPDMLRELKKADSPRFVHVGIEGVKSLIHRGVEVARSQRLSSIRGMALTLILMWVFGHGCFEDPLQPWIAQTLRDTATSEPEDRARLLKTRAFAWLEQLLAYQAEGVRS
ncbi:hypothetical protein F0U61_15630 [Archangium violaceum]|uniref:hypothetical protein n=1 Tax=Archangium violaceum TaxID=83451 RepID=UPI002B2A5B8C|nr:hypothetical protein F0U61_15630 [Archangium violaceum]